MSYSDTLFRHALEYQNKRAKITNAYDKTMTGLADKKGSSYYVKQSAKARTDRDTELTALREKYWDIVDDDINNMMNHNKSRGVAAPTDEEARIISTLKLRDSVTEDELDRIANAVKSSELCLSVVNEVARKNGIWKIYNDMFGGTEMTVTEAEKELVNLSHFMEDFLKYDTEYASKRFAEYYDRHHGPQKGTDSTQPAKRRLFSTKEEFYSYAIRLDGDMLKKFCNAVDGEE